MKTSFIATGDSFITRHVAEEGYDGFEELKALISRHDVRFANLEMTFHRSEGYPAASSGGTWAMTDPSMLDDMLRYGFNLFNTANNHSGDYGQGGVSATIRHVEERGMTFAGTGNTLQEASAACYLETPNARVALIGLTSSLDPAAIAGGQGSTVGGRPGLNPLRFRTVHHVNAEHFEMVKDLARVTKANAKEDYSIKTGYSLPYPEGTFPLGKLNFALTDGPEWNETIPDKRDMKRTLDEIAEAKRQADVVLVSVHSHEMPGDDPAVCCEFLETFAHECIDAGATAIIGHGPHVLRGIELYHGGVIFYSLGNFIFQTETVAKQPFDAFYGKGLPQETKVGAYMDMRSKNGTRGYAVQEDIWRAVAASWELEDGKLTGVTLYPITLGQHERRSVKGIPKLSRDRATLEHLARLSEPYGTKIEIEDGLGRIVLP
ncbi:MAG: CapA family protein [Sutterellaceae bacterium]|nr:CapA family protein [Sutterellaceae bacterium]MDD7441641.1 CapA family protein [Sutterellaceae bacterium]MDY2867975.1 CapA family protein [Mesosutterella sp.]